MLRRVSLERFSLWRLRSALRALAGAVVSFSDSLQKSRSEAGCDGGTPAATRDTTPGHCGVWGVRWPARPDQVSPGLELLRNHEVPEWHVTNHKLVPYYHRGTDIRI